VQLHKDPILMREKLQILARARRVQDRRPDAQDSVQPDDWSQPRCAGDVELDPEVQPGDPVSARVAGADCGGVQEFEGEDGADHPQGYTYQEVGEVPD